MSRAALILMQASLILHNLRDNLRVLQVILSSYDDNFDDDDDFIQDSANFCIISAIIYEF